MWQPKQDVICRVVRTRGLWSEIVNLIWISIGVGLTLC